MFKSFILMVQFLTRLPINISVEVNKDTIARGTLFFPLIGMIIGSIASGVYYLLNFINSDIAALGAVFTIIGVTGGLHVDGLSDTADGFFSSRTRERILEIMKDSRVGTFGVIAIVFDILFKYVLLKNMYWGTAVAALILSCGIGRAASAMFFTFGKSARESGLGSMFMGNNTRKNFVLGSIIFGVLGILIAKEVFIIVFIIVICFAYGFMKYSYKVIGGLTGDVCGAVCELSEILSLLLFMVVGKWI